MNENLLCSRQAGFLVFFLLLGSAIIYAPEIVAGRDAWLATLLASGIGLYILYALLTVQTLFPGLDIMQISRMTLGNIPGTLLNLFLIWFFFVNAMLYIYDLGLVLKFILPVAQRVSIYSVFILAAAYVLYSGVNTLGRLADLLAVPALMLIMLGFFLLLGCCADFGHVIPLLADWKRTVGACVYGANRPFANVAVLGMFLCFTGDLKTKKNAIYYWYLTGVLVLALRSLILVTTLGQEFAQHARFPLFESFRVIAFSNIQRIELLFFMVWFITGFFAVAIFYQALVAGLSRTLRMNSSKALIIPVGLLLVTFCNYAYASDFTMVSLESPTEPFHLLPIQILYPTIVLVSARLYARANPVKPAAS